MSPNIAAILGIVAAIACTVLALIFITPEKKRASLPKFFQIVHDIFNFKFLLLEYLMKALYILATLYSICYGFFLLFSGYSYGSYYYSSFESTAGYGLLMMLLGPIVIRIVYEFIMMAILAVNNIIAINKKLKNQNGDNASSDAPKAFNPADYITPKAPKTAEVPVPPVAPVAPAAPAEDWVYCVHCGHRYDQSKGGCPSCGRTNN